MKQLRRHIFSACTVGLILSMSGCSNSDGNSTSELVMPYQPAGWFMSTGVIATASDGKVYKHTSAGVFGELLQSSDAKDRHDIPGYGTAILQLVFPQTTWDNDNGDYFSDYRMYDKTDTSKKSWLFQVKNQHTVDLANAAIVITFEGPFDVTYYTDDFGGIRYESSNKVDTEKRAMVSLVDVDNQEVYSYDQLTTANLTMDGLHTRTFRWVIGQVDGSDMTPLAAAVTGQVHTLSTVPTTMPTTKQSKFGLPPR